MSVAASVIRGLGGGLFALAVFAAVAALVVALIGNDWLKEGNARGDDDQAEAGADMLTAAAAIFAGGTVAGVLGGFLFWMGSSLLRRYEARYRDGAMPPLPGD